MISRFTGRDSCVLFLSDMAAGRLRACLVLAALCVGTCVGTPSDDWQEDDYGSELVESGLPGWSGLPGVVNGWNTTVGTADERAAAAKHFGVSVTAGSAVWLKNVMSPFIGKTLNMTGIQINQRNAFNTVIEIAVKSGTVLWTVEEGPLTASGPWDEHINGGYTGTAHIVSRYKSSLACLF